MTHQFQMTPANKPIRVILKAGSARRAANVLIAAEINQRNYERTLAGEVERQASCALREELRRLSMWFARLLEEE